MRRIVRLLPLVALALGQAVLTVGMTVFVFGSEMSRFDAGDPAPVGVHMASALVGALAYPVLPLVAKLPLTMQPSGFPGEHLVFVANGLVSSRCGDGGYSALLGPWPRSGCLTTATADAAQASRR
jgi:hypothetical protein